MPPRRSTGAGAGAAGTRSKRSALGQPTLSFAQQRKTTSSAKGSKPKSASAAAAGQQRTQSTESITVRESTPTPEPELEVKGDINLQETPQNEVTEKVERKKLNPKSKEWAGVYGDAKVAMGNMDPIHAGRDTHNQVHHILRVFDMTSKYGPSVGITRLQRWERAQKWGLNPPKEIKLILTTKEGEEDASYRENVLHTWL